MSNPFGERGEYLQEVAEQPSDKAVTTPKEEKPKRAKRSTTGVKKRTSKKS